MKLKDVSIRVRETEIKYDGRESLAAQYISEKTMSACNQPYKLKSMLVNYFKAFEDEKERFVVLMLDTKLKLIGINLVSVGSLNSTQVHMREAFRAAIVCGANSVMTAHNHPSGEVEPSTDDYVLFDRMEKAGQLLGISVLDNFVVSTRGEGKIYSDTSCETI